MSLEISIDSLESSRNHLNRLADTADRIERRSRLNHLNQAFSQIPGLGFLAAEHGRTLAGNPGSAAEEFAALSSKIHWAANNLHTLAEAVYEQDGELARSLDNMQAGHAGSNTQFFTAAEPNDKAAPVVINNPVIGYVPSINLLASYFDGTLDSAAHHDAELWQQIGNTATDISNALEDIASELETNNYGAAISGGAHKLRSFAESGRVLHANSQVMHGTINNLISAVESTRKATKVVQASVTMNLTPGASETVEANYLAAFPAHFSAALQAAVPRLSGLTIPQPEASGGANQAVGSAHSASGADQARAQFQLPRDVQQVIGDYGTNQASFAAADEGTASLANVGNAEGHTAAASHNAALDRTSATLGSQPTTASALNSPQPGINHAAPGTINSPSQLPSGLNGAPASVSPNISPNTGASRVLGAGNSINAINTAASQRAHAPAPGNSTAPGVFGGQPHGLSPGAGNLGASNNSSPGANSTARGAINNSAPLGTGIRAIGSAGLPSAGPLGSSHGENLTTRPIGTGGPAPSAGNSGNPGGSGPGTSNGGHNNAGQHGSQGSHSNQQTSGHGSGNSAGNSSRAHSAHTGRGMIPMMGGAGQTGQGMQAGSKKTRTKAVTTAVEREGNQKALLGQRRPVVPGVIGAWVRE
ncbi:serine-rich family protein [Corynebacterium sp. MNWGS58]|uniref:hypothetical protein n=1 Tax=Corynebacterium sp. 102791.4 TaxID=3104612 RepID=UPI00351543A7